MHPEIATTAEPWILLPLLGAYDQDILLSQYNHRTCRSAIQSFISQAGPKEALKAEALKNYGMTFYRAFESENVSYFLDKTPRYHFASLDITKAFKGDAKYILLWRNPLAVLASIIETFGKGRWNIHRWRFDLFAGVEGLHRLKAEAKETLVEIQYEKLVSGDDAEWLRLFSGLNLEFDVTYIENLKNKQITGLGDPTGQSRYANVSSGSLDRWRDTFCTLKRKRFARDWLHWIGEQRLSRMGYSLDELLGELEQIPNLCKKTFIDLPYAFRDKLAIFLEYDAIYHRRDSLREGRETYPWT